MRHFYSLIFLFIVCACTEEKSIERNESDILSFYSIDDITRANEVTGFVDGDAIGIYVLDKSSNSTLKPIGNYADNRKYVFNGEERIFEAANNDNLIFNSPDKQLEFYVYFPYYEQVLDATNLLHVLKGTGRKDDFLFAVNREYAGDKNIPISFKHLLAKTEVKYTSTENRDKAQMNISTYTDVKVNLADGTVTTVTNRRADFSLEKIVYDDRVSFVGVVAPQIWAVGEKFGVLSYSDRGSYPFSFPSARTFTAGELNTVTFMPKLPAYDFSVSPVTLSTAAKDITSYPFSVTSTKSQAINGVILPNTTETIGYTLTANSDWVTVTGNTVAVAENRGTARTGTATFTQEESGKTVSLEIQQAAGVVTYDYLFTYDNSASSTSWTSISASGDSRSFGILSSKDIYINGTKEGSEPVGYTATANVNWVTVSGSTITVTENMGTTPRGGVVTFTQSESGKTITVTLLQLKKSSVDIN